MTSFTFPPHSLSLTQRFLRNTFIITGCLFSAEVLAAEDGQFNSAFNMPGIGISLMALMGNVSGGFGDIMTPLLGRATNFFYLDPQGMMHSSDEYAGSMGVGQRWLSNKAGILGAYVFADYNHSLNGNGFWFASPGIERLGETLDFSANVYIPVGSHEEAVSGSNTQTSGTVFQGHGLFYQTILNSTSETVGIGGDVQIGYRLPFKNNTKVYVGGYYSNPEDDTNITGVAARVEVPINKHVSLELSEAYDNEANNTIKAGVLIDFGGRNTHFDFKGDLADRMLDPIQRNLIAIAGSSHTSQPIDEVDETTVIDESLQSDISFFVEGNSEAQAGQGTFESPYINFNSANVNDANTGPNTTFYVQSGTYSVQNAVTLQNDQVFGRTTLNGIPFMAPATGSNRPNITFASDGITNNAADTSDLISALQLHGTSFAGTGIDMVSNAVMTATITDTTADGFDTGIAAHNNGAGTMTVAFTDDEATANVDGMLIENASSGTLNFTGTDITADMNSNNGLTLINLNPTGTLSATIDPSSFSNNGNDGVLAVNGNQTTPNSTTGTLTLTLTDNAFNQNANNGMEVIQTATGLLDTGTTTITDTGSTFNQNAHDGIEITHSSAGTIGLTTIGSLLQQNARHGLELTNNDVGTLTALLRNLSTFSGNGGGGVAAANRSTGTMDITLRRAVLDGNMDGLSAVNGVAGNAVSGTMNISVAGLIPSSFNGNSNVGLRAEQINNGTAGDTGTLTVDINGGITTTFDQNGNTGLLLINNSTGAVSLDSKSSSFSNTVNGNGLEARNNSSGTLDVTADDSDNLLSNNGNAMLMVNGGAGALTLNTSGSFIDSNTGDGLLLQNTGAGTLTANVIGVAATEQFVSNNMNGVEAKNTSSGNLIVNVSDANFADNGGDGILLTNQSTGTLTLTSAAGVASMHTSNNGNGLEAVNQGSGTLNISADKSRFSNNDNDGILLSNGVDGIASTGTLTLTLTGVSAASRLTGNDNGIESHNYSNGTVNINLDNTVLDTNRNSGLLAENGASGGTATGNTNVNITSVKGTSSASGNGDDGITAQNNAQGTLALTSSGAHYTSNSNGWLINNTSTGAVTASSTNSEIFSGNTIDGWQVINDVTGGTINASSTSAEFSFNSSYGVFGQNTGANGDVTIGFTTPLAFSNGAGSTNAPGGNVTWVNPPP